MPNVGEGLGKSNCEPSPSAPGLPERLVSGNVIKHQLPSNKWQTSSRAGTAGRAFRAGTADRVSAGPVYVPLGTAQQQQESMHITLRFRVKRLLFNVPRGKIVVLP